MRHRVAMIMPAILLLPPILARAADRVIGFKDNDAVNAVCFSPDGGKVLTGSSKAAGRDHGQVRLWERATGARIPQPQFSFASAVSAAAISPDGELIAVSTAGIVQGPADKPTRVVRGELKLFVAATGKLRTTLKGPALECPSLAFSTDGKLVAAGSGDVDEQGAKIPGGLVRVWDVATGDEKITLTGHKGIVQSVAFAPDGMTLAAASRTVPM